VNRKDKSKPDKPSVTAEKPKKARSKDASPGADKKVKRKKKDARPAPATRESATSRPPDPAVDDQEPNTERRPGAAAGEVIDAFEGIDRPTLPVAPLTAEEAPVVTRSEPAPASESDAAKIRAHERRLERFTRGGDTSVEDVEPASIREQVSSAAREVVDRLAAPVARVDEANVVNTVRELLSSDYYLRQWGRLGMRNRSEEVDDFGLDPVYEERLRPVADFLYKRYFRVEVDGVENIPSSGRCLVVANHSGALPLDGLMLRTSVRLEHPSGRELRWLAEDYVYYLPFVGAFISRVGGVRACQENAERLLNKESLVGVFPEGVKGIGKLYKDRYKLQRFGRGGFIRLCLRTGTPLVPCVIVGAEEASPMLYRDERASKLLGLPYLPVTPTFPWFGPLGLLPAPTKWHIRFGEMVQFDGHGPEAADDPVLVGRLADRVRAGIQQMLDSSLANRKSIWFG
jgi:1-acyl-sn-glycerol-3-phosphate acyltransferase